MTYLTASDPTQSGSYRYFAELASTELDYDGVPEYFRIVDVQVSEPTQTAIEHEIAARDWLKGYTLINYWQPEDCSNCPF